MKFAIIVLFAFAGGRGEGVGDDRFATIAACESARPAMVAGFKQALRLTHGDIEIISSHCGLASEIGAEPVL